MTYSVPAAWAQLPFFAKKWPALRTALEADTRTILPRPDHVFAALDALGPDDVRVVILGQDPYPTPGHAHGHAFSVEPDVTPLPRSLKNIYTEMTEDLGGCPTTGDLRFWAGQGVLLLNTALTVPAGDAGAHAKLGWRDLTEDVLKVLDHRPRAFVLWGLNARLAAQSVQLPHHLRIETAHPSPLSARRGFFGSRPFSRVNDWLKSQGTHEIDWIGHGPDHP
ncbi:MAG: uracil-DNA glycosylase [Marinovum sp.]|nr:uracil-DNA glycosylase [Marinovum sp.]